MARYDGIAEWYDEKFAAESLLAALPRRTALELLGPPRGTLVDIGCGGGSHAAAFAAAGWQVTGVDVSADQLRLARARGVHVVQAPAEELPFADESFDAAVSIWTHTDIDNWGDATREVARVLRPGGPFVYFGIHPCFVGPHSRFVPDEGLPELHPGYWRTNRYFEGPGVRGGGIRIRVGAVHVPLGRFLQAFLDAGLQIERVEELGHDGYNRYPHVLALRSRA